MSSATANEGAGALAARRDDVAIVGMACRFPGARNLNQYWRLLTAPHPQFTTVPDSRWRAGAFLSDDFRDASSAYTDRMALLPDVGHFDAAHYGIPPRRARSMDPQHRLLIDLAREALQDAGWEAEGFDREETSVITSLTESGYRDISAMQIRMRQLAGGEFGARATGPGLREAVRAVDGLHGSSVAGLLLNMGPNTISSVFDLHGESYALDSACSGGLMAVANAVYALRAGRSRIALAGGAQLMLTPDLLIGLCRIGAVSRSGQCLPFGAEADGFVLGEGAGVLVLRPLADALAAGDRVYAVIRGVGTANDGTVQGGLHPQAAGQLRALRRAYRDAGLAPASVGYLEAHGTGTAVGDPVEIGVLRELRGDAGAPAYLGAVKAVLGHSLNAAGIAGLIKTVLAVQRGVVPPQPEFGLADRSALDAAGLSVATAPSSWPATDEPRRAGVSAFGFGGTGVHLVVEECVPAPAPAVPDGEPQLLVLSGRDRAGLARYARELADTLTADRPPLAAVADTLARRTPFAERLALVAQDTEDAVAKLVAAAEAVAAGRSGEFGPGQLAGTVADGEPAEAVVPAPGSLPAEARTAALAGLAEQAVTGRGLRPLTVRTPPSTLPPSPLAPRHHWVVAEAERDVAEPPAPAAGSAAAAAGAPVRAADATTTATATATAIVLEEVSRTGVFPLSDLDGRMTLVTDLGFDSLMLQELEVNIGKRVPGFRSEELYEPGVTVEGLSALVGPHLDGAQPARPHPDLPYPDLPYPDLPYPDLPGTAGEPLPEPLPSPLAEPRPRLMRVPQPRQPEPPAQQAWALGTASVDDFPEVRQFEERLGAITASGAAWPYFRVHQGNIRDTTVIGGRPYLSFGSYNYLGLSGHPAVNRAVHEAVERYGTSVSASRVLSGERDLTVTLERALAGFLGVPDCLTLVSGHATNVTAIGHLVGPGDLVVHDALAHDSILQGCTLSGAARRPFAHNDTGQLEHMLRLNRSRFRRVLIAVEGAYSMDGDLVDLPAVIELKKRYGALLLVDEAHSIGTVGAGGRGVGEFFGVDRADVDLWMGTLSKAFASCGGYLGGSARMVRWLRHTLPGFVYSVGLTPANAAAALAATELITAEPHRVGALRRNAELFLGLAGAAGLATGSSAHTPIVPCILGDSAHTLRVADRLFARGLIADPIFHPAVEEGLSRLRFFVTCEHREEDIRRAVAILAEEVAAVHV
ncbi:aminotransferase class I/II-fold pyridoxal phosphate-dependent enzyme [Kitasatospora sp. A2-31]|uniref:aminotransferase class I/II-fold pyridoxal phosphate-dependent enzyme n=1 Tax=Kitasatospora sp. A2-31 TaxID=2916414 RepID=UPI001EEA4204|nr:aminotransferase class I/II-fold pyridoxal phosphate-dependent enzyme [Kitasatospora sp. A2-31]MCG6494547.1 aminotransferase class I/II-fold pyridoxal phosphate-dependent enzyme [Kitasatospora sp. A2-31]